MRSTTGQVMRQSHHILRGARNGVVARDLNICTVRDIPKHFAVEMKAKKRKRSFPSQTAGQNRVSAEEGYRFLTRKIPNDG